LKQLFKALFATALISSAMISSVAYAEQKIGVINRQAIIQQMPQAIAMQQALQIELKDEGAKIDAMRQQMAADLEKLRKDAPTMSETQIKAEQERLQKKNAEYEAVAKPFQEKVKARQQEENIKVVQLLNTAIQQVIDEDKFDLVLDAQAVVYATPAHNISEKVLKKVSAMK
jgi:outer membrane protein